MPQRLCGFHPNTNPEFQNHINHYIEACKLLVKPKATQVNVPTVEVDLTKEITIPVKFSVLAGDPSIANQDLAQKQSQLIIDTLNHDYNNYKPQGQSGGNRDLYNEVINEVFSSADSATKAKKIAIYESYASAIPTAPANINFVIDSVKVFNLDQPIETSDDSFQVDVKQAIRDAGANTSTPDSLSIWAVDVQGTDILGLSNFPWEDHNDTHGVILALGVFYPPLMGPPQSNPYNLYKTAPHEVGHWLGLLHTFTVSEAEFKSYEAVNVDDEKPSTGEVTGDFIDDTPPQNVASSDPTEDSTLTDLRNNPLFPDFMDYSIDKYLCIFTHDQLYKVRYMLSKFRTEIWNGIH